VTAMKKNITMAGIVIFIVGLLLLLLKDQIWGLVIQDVITDMNPESLIEIFGSLLTASVMAGNIYKIIGIIGLSLIIIGLLLVIIGYLSKEKNIKSFKKRKTFPKNTKAKYTRSLTNKKAKVASFIVTGWGRKNKKAKRVKLKPTKKNKKIKDKKYQIW
jgi:hypothetical protein